MKQPLKSWLCVVAISGVLACPAALASQTTGTIAGIVNGSNGRPLPGAAVAVTGSTRGTQTGADGRFSLSGVTPGARTVRANFAGYLESERAVTVVAGQTANVTIQLTQSAVKLEGLVAVGYGTQRKQDVTGAVSTISVQENISGMPVTGADAALKGQIAGVQISTSVGTPGGGPTIHIRGTSAVGAASTPLYVVDGFPIQQRTSTSGVADQVRNPLNDIPPEDIESISVLKDASATSIYGSRGSNGVVIITTKKGRAGVKPTINVSAYTGTQALAKWGAPDLLNAEEFANLMRERSRDALYMQARNRTPTASPATWEPTQAQVDANLPAEWRPWLALGPDGTLSRYAGKGTNWFNEATANAPIDNVQMSVSGGSERLRSYLSGGFLRQEGIQINTGYKRASMRANIDANLSDRLSLSVQMAPTFTFRNLASDNGTGPGLSTYPIYSARDSTTGDLVPLFKCATTAAAGNCTNPLWAAKLRAVGERSLRMLGSTALSYKLLDGLTFRSSLNADRTDERRNSFNPSTILLADGSPSIPSGTWVVNQNWAWTNENTFTLAPREIFASNFVDAVLGFNVERNRLEAATFNGTNFPDDFVRLVSAAGTLTSTLNASTSGLVSYLGRVNYNIADNVILTGTVRRDGSSRFGQDRRWGNFPSAAVAWNVSHAGFMRGVGMVQDVKLRASYGLSGNNQIGDFSYLGLLGTNNYVLSGALAPGRQLTSMGNSALGWERLKEVNLGLDAGFLDGRASFTADAYQRTTNDLLLDFDVPESTGFNSVKTNLGSVQNRGLELSLNTENFSGKRFAWNSNANISFNRNKVLDLGPGRDFLLSGFQENSRTHISQVGQPLAMFWGFQSDGIYSFADDKNGNGIIDAGDGIPYYAGATPGSAKWKDLDGNGVIELEKDFGVNGSPYPKYQWGLTNNVTAGPFDLRVLVTGAMGASKLKIYYTQQHNLDMNFNVASDYKNRWRPGINEDPNAPVPLVIAGLATNPSTYFRNPSNFMIQKADYAWIKNVTLRYSLPGRLMVGGAQRGSVYASIDNPWLFTNYNGNPEAERFGDVGPGTATQSPSLTPGVDNNPYPVARTLTLGFDLGL